jgi:hypothetical protein
MDPDQPIAAVKTMNDWVDSSVRTRPVIARHCSRYLRRWRWCLRRPGIYGVDVLLSCAANARDWCAHGIRARRFDVLKLVVRQGMIVTLIGVVVGLSARLR